MRGRIIAHSLLSEILKSQAQTAYPYPDPYYRSIFAPYETQPYPAQPYPSQPMVLFMPSPLILTEFSRRFEYSTPHSGTPSVNGNSASWCSIAVRSS